MSSLPATTPRARRKRQEILDAAADVFCDEGYELASMDRIAERAGASKRTVYNHFGSKEALFHAVLERFYDEVSALQPVAWDPGQSVEDQLIAFARARSEMIANPRWRGLMLVGLGVCVQAPGVADETLNRSEPGTDAVEQWLRAAHAGGALNVPYPEAAAALFMGMVSGVLFWPQLLGGPMPAAERARVTAEVVETFLSRFRR